MVEYRVPPETMKEELDGLYGKLDPLYLDPGFRVMDLSIWKEPKKALEPAIWKWSEGRAALEEVARIVGPEHAERRNLIMRNPAEGHAYGTLRTMISAYQLMLPGEFARSGTPNSSGVFHVWVTRRRRSAAGVNRSASSRGVGIAVSGHRTRSGALSTAALVSRT